MKGNDLGKAIMEGACNPEVKEIAVEMGEVGLDSFLNDGVLKEIPVIATILAFRQTWTGFHDRLFLKKVATFIFTCPKFTNTEREAFFKEHLSDQKKMQRLGNTIVLILDKLDDMEKPVMLAKAFAALVRKEIEVETFRRLAAAINNGFLEDLNALFQETDVCWRDDLLRKLLFTGFVEISDQKHSMANAQIPDRLWIAYKISPLGKAFIKCMSDGLTTRSH